MNFILFIFIYIFYYLYLFLFYSFKKALKFQLSLKKFFSNVFYFVYFCWCKVQDYCLEEILLFWTGDKKEDEKNNNKWVKTAGCQTNDGKFFSDFITITHIYTNMHHAGFPNWKCYVSHGFTGNAACSFANTYVSFSLHS